jgi:hypothetical protein
MINGHRSIVSSKVTVQMGTILRRGLAPSLAAVVGLLLCVLLGACSTIESRVRVVSRAGTVHDVVVIPALDTATPIRVAAGADVLTDAELADFQARLPALLKASLDATALSASTDPIGSIGILKRGHLQIVRIRVKAAVGRHQHRILADCRLRVQHGADMLVDVEGTAVAVVQARNVSVVELDGIIDEMKNHGGRNPLLQAEDTEEAVVAACTSALAAIVDDSRPDDAVVDAGAGRGAARVARKEARLQRRRRALERLADEVVRTPRQHDALAAALVDVGDTGGVGDAPAIGAFLHDAHPLVKKASTLAFQTLCAGHTVLPPDEDAVARCTPPAAPAPTALAEPAPAVEVRHEVRAGIPDDGEDGDDDDDDDDGDNAAPSAPASAPVIAPVPVPADNGGP